VIIARQAGQFTWEYEYFESVTPKVASQISAETRLSGDEQYENTNRQIVSLPRGMENTLFGRKCSKRFVFDGVMFSNDGVMASPEHGTK
jgi:hypothetical protein